MIGPVDLSAGPILSAITDYGATPAAYNLVQLQGWADAAIKWSGVFGLRTSLIVAQMFHETGYLRFGGDVSADQFNFAGLGATGGGVAGMKYADMSQGVCAVCVHHMVYIYGDVANWPAVVRNYQTLDQRYRDVLSAGYGGVIKVAGDYTNGRWAYTKTIPKGSLANGYAQAMVDGANALLAREGGEETTVADVDDSVATWQPSPNFGSGRDGKPIQYIILHTTEGAYDGSVGWLRNAKSQASATYVVSADGQRVAQLVREADTSWAAGNLDYNQRGVNIEQEGYAAKGGFSDGLYQTVGALVGRIAQRHGIPLDRQHVIGHMDVPDPNNPALTGGIDHHTDPGKLYDFDRVLAIAKGQSGAPAPAASDERKDPVTGFKLIGGIRAFYEDLEQKLGAGDALMLIGRPLNDEHPSGDATVQDFERARLEWRKGQRPDRWDIMLGLVNAELLAAQKAVK